MWPFPSWGKPHSLFLPILLGEDATLATLTKNPYSRRADTVVTYREAPPNGTPYTTSVDATERVKNPTTVLEVFRRGDDEGSRLLFIGEGSL